MSRDCNSCSYNCSETPSNLCPYTDVTGIGVILGYAVTGFLTVLIAFLNYVLVFSPATYPFENKDGPSDEKALEIYRPNPIDEFILGPSTKRRIRNSREKILIKCVLTMSDLQILTGISILAAGYAQLPCGLSAYHWQIIVYLAWFSSLTHLSCLSILQKYLYQHPVQRIWRLTGMAVTVAMLVTATVPTGNFNWLNAGKPKTPAASYAICLFKRKVDKSSENYPSMVISVLLLVFGFIHRVVRLHKRLSIDIVLRLRRVLSKFARSRLRKVYVRFDENPHSLGRYLLYRPLLAGFLTLRVILDLWSSMFVEIWWLIVAFVWGLIRLWSTLKLYKFDAGRSAWTFGQIIPIVLLVAPIITFVEIYFEEHDAEDSVKVCSGTTTATGNGSTHFQKAVLASPGSGEASDQAARSATDPAEQSPPRPQPLGVPGFFQDEPDLNFYREDWFNHIVFFSLWVAFSLGVGPLLMSGLQWEIFRYFTDIPGAYFFETLPIVTTWVLLCFTIFIITVNDIASYFRDVFDYRYWKDMANGVIYVSCAFIHLCFGIGFSDSPSGSINSVYAIITPYVSLVLTLVLFLRYQLSREGSFSFLKEHRGLVAFRLIFYCACGAINFFTLTAAANSPNFAENDSWLYLVIPPAGYVVLGFVYMFWPQLRTNMRKQIRGGLSG